MAAPTPEPAVTVTVTRPALEHLARAILVDNLDGVVSESLIDDLATDLAIAVARFGVDTTPTTGSTSATLLAALCESSTVHRDTLLTDEPKARVERSEALDSLEAAGYVDRVDIHRYAVTSLGVRAVASGRTQVGVTVDLTPGSATRRALGRLALDPSDRLSLSTMVNVDRTRDNDETFMALSLLTAAGYATGDSWAGFRITPAGQDALNTITP